MNGIEKIAVRIRQETQREIDQILEDARIQADQIRAEDQVRVDSERIALFSRNEKDAKEREERMVSMAQMECRKWILAVKQEMIGKAYQKAEEELSAMTAPDDVELLTKLLVSASSTKQEEVVFSQKDAEKIGALVVKKANERLNQGALTVSKEHREISGGFILKDGNVEVNCTWETLVRLQKQETAGVVAKKLFPEW